MAIRRRNLQTGARCNIRALIVVCLCFVSFLHVYLASTLKATRRAESSIASTKSAIMDNFRRDKKSSAIDYPELEDIDDQNSPLEGQEEETGHNESVEGNSSPEVPEIKIEETMNIIGESKKLNIIAAEEPASSPKATIAYAVSLTSCGATYIADGAAVLKHSIALSSYPLNKDSKYAYKMFAFVHPQAVECSQPFEKLGYEVQVRETPIDASKIKGDFLREKVVITGCCQEKEYLKLYAYTLIEFPVVVHLDLDSLILQPFDDLYDSMIDGDNGKLPIMHNSTAPTDIQAFYTKDYNMIRPGHPHPGVQGGFIVIKPNLDYFEEYRQTILEGDFKSGAGWGGKWGGYFGAQQIQGLCSYFFEALHPGSAVELNRCMYNSMNDNPVEEIKGKMLCRDGKPTCDDCRTTPIEKVKSIHFTLCQKPWICPFYVLHDGQCAEFHKKWFSIRKDWEESNGLDKIDTSTINFYNDVFQGYCKGEGERQYTKIRLS